MFRHQSFILREFYRVRECKYITLIWYYTTLTRMIKVLKFQNT